MTYFNTEELEDIQAESNKPGCWTIIILILLVLAMLGSMMWPFFQPPRVRYRPTPTSPFLQEA